MYPVSSPDILTHYRHTNDHRLERSESQQHWQDWVESPIQAGTKYAACQASHWEDAPERHLNGKRQDCKMHKSLAQFVLTFSESGRTVPRYLVKPARSRPSA